MARILVIDDEKKLNALIQQRLEAAGHHVTAAYDGEEGLEKAQSTNPDLTFHRFHKIMESDERPATEGSRGYH